MFFIAGETANGQELTRVIIEADNEKDAVKYLLDVANMYFRRISPAEITGAEDEVVDLTCGKYVFPVC